MEKKRRRWLGGGVSGARLGAAVVLAFAWIIGWTRFQATAVEFPDAPVYMRILEATWGGAVYFLFVWGIPYIGWRSVSWALRRSHASQRATKWAATLLVCLWIGSLPNFQRLGAQSPDLSLSYRAGVVLGSWLMGFALTFCVPYFILRSARSLRRRS